MPDLTTADDQPTAGRRYWVREPGVRVRSGPGLQHPVLAQLARGQTVTATQDPSIAADGYHWQPIRQGEALAYVAQELLAAQYVRPDPVGPVPVATELGAAVQGTPLADHTRALMAIAICESGARTARDNGGELVHRFETAQWDRLFRDRLGDPPAAWTAEKCHVTSWGVGQVMGWAHATFGCADALAFRDWLQEDPGHEYEALVRFCLAKPGVTNALQNRDWEQLWQLYNGGHPQWLNHFQEALKRVVDADLPAAAPTVLNPVTLPPAPEPVAPELSASDTLPGTPLPHAVPASPPFGALAETAAPGPAVPVSSAWEPDNAAAPREHDAKPPPSAEAPGGTRRAVTIVRPALSGLRYEGNRLLRRGLLVGALFFSLWQTGVLTSDQIVDLLHDALVPLVTFQTGDVERRLDGSLDTLEARLEALEQGDPDPMPASAETVPDSSVALPLPTLTPAPTATLVPTPSPVPPPTPTSVPAPTLAPTVTPTATLTAAPVACTPRQIVTTARYNVRVAPAPEADVVAILGPGSPVCVLDQQGGWSHLQEPEGWIANGGLSPLPLAG